MPHPGGNFDLAHFLPTGSPRELVPLRVRKAARNDILQKE